MSGTSDETTLNDAINAAYTELAIRKAAYTKNPSAATSAAVLAIEERIAGYQSQLAGLLQEAPRPGSVPTAPPVPDGPPAPTTTTTTTTTPDGPPAPTTTTTTPGGATGTGAGGGPVDGPTGPLTGAYIAALLATTLSGDNGELAQFLDTSGQDVTSANGWDYIRDTIDTTFTDLEGSFESIGASSFAGGTAVSLTEIGAGVTADVADIEVVGLAAALLLGEYASGWLLAHVADWFPNPSIFGWHPLNFIVEGVTSLGNQFETSAKGIGTTIYDVFTQPIRAITGLFQRSANATASAHNKIARVVNDTIPSATQGIAATANTYTDERIATITGAAAQALVQLDPPPTLAQARAIIGEAVRYGTLVWQFEAVAASAIISAGDYTDTVASATSQQIAAAQAKAESDAAQALQTLQSNLISRLTGDEQQLAGLATTVTVTVPSEIATQVQQAIAAEDQKITGISSTMEQQIQTLQGQMQTLAQRATTDETTIATAQAQLNILTNEGSTDESAIVALQQTIGVAQQDLNTTTQAISDLETQITGISDTLAPVRAAQQLNTSQLAPYEEIGAVALPTVLATLSTQVTKIKTEIDECMVDNCDTTNPNNIRNVLKGLLELFTAAAEVGFIADAVRDPLGVANTLAPLLDSIDEGAVGTLNALLSL